jgi:hypothetical protein
MEMDIQRSKRKWKWTYEDTNDILLIVRMAFAAVVLLLFLMRFMGVWR